MRVVLISSLLVGAMVACSNDQSGSDLAASKMSNSKVPVVEEEEEQEEAFVADIILECRVNSLNQPKYKIKVVWNNLEQTRLYEANPNSDEFKLVDAAADTVLRHSGFPGAGVVVGMDVSAESKVDFSERCYDTLTSYEFGLNMPIGYRSAEGTLQRASRMVYDPSGDCDGPRATPIAQSFEVTCFEVAE